MVPQRAQILKCELGGEKACGVIVEVIEGCGTDCDLLCCGQQMALLAEKTSDQGKEKHVPVIEKIPGGFKVKVGSVPHPMAEDHYIQFIEVQAGSKLYREYLKPGQAPEAVFKIDADKVTAREHCNKHGLWRS